MGTLDQTAELQAVIDATPNGSIVKLDHTVEGTITVRDRQLIYTGRIRTLTDTGGLTDPKAARVRSTFELHGGHHTFLGIQFDGPCRGGKGPKVIIDGRLQTAYEGQSFIAARATNHLHLCGGRIEGPWGDALHLSWEKVDGRRTPCTDTSLLNVDITNTGRCAVVANDFRGLSWRGGTITNTAGSMFDVEPATGSNNKDARLVGITRQGTGAFFAHLHGGSPLENVYIEDCVSIDSPVSVECIGPSEGGFRNVNVLDNVWFEKQAGGRFMRYMNVHELTVRGNEGPVRDTTNGRRIIVSNCPGAVIGPNTLTVV